MDGEWIFYYKNGQIESKYTVIDMISKESGRYGKSKYCHYIYDGEFLENFESD